MNTELLNLVGQTDYISDWDLAKKQSKKPDTVFGSTRHALKQLEQAGMVAIIGKKYIDQHGKLFDVYTARVNAIPERTEAYRIKSKNQQVLNLANALYSEFKEHNAVQPLKDAADMIGKGMGKIALEYHQLTRDDVLNVYDRIIKDAPAWFVSEAKYYREPERNNSGSIKKWKIPF